MEFRRAPRRNTRSASPALWSADDGRVLVIRRDDNGRWEAPGGAWSSRTFEAGVRREVLEETAWRSPSSAHRRYKNLTHGIVALVYRCSAGRGRNEYD